MNALVDTVDVEHRSNPTAARRRAVTRLMPWVLTIGTCAFLFSNTSPEAIVREVGHGDVTWLLPLAAWVTIQGLLIAALADRWVILAAAPDPERAPRYLEVAAAKAGVGLLEVVNYAVGRGGYGVWIARKAGTGAALASGAVLYLVLGDIAAVTTVLTTAVFLGGADVPSSLRLVAPLVAAGIWAVVILAPVWPFGVDKLPRPLRPLVNLPLAKVAPQIGLRMINIAFGCFMTWFAARTFGLDLPVEVALVYMPVVLVVTSLPINVAGIGPATAAWTVFFGAYAADAQILAFQMLWSLAIVSATVVRGLPFVRRFVRDIADGGAPQRHDETVSNATERTSSD